MLATACFLVCVCGLEPLPQIPVSAAAAIVRVRMAEAQEHKRARLEQAVKDDPDDLDAFFEKLLTTPVAMINDATLTIADATMNCRAAMRRDLSRYSGGDVTEAIIRDFVLARLPMEIEEEVLWQAAQRDFSAEQFQDLVETLGLYFDNQIVFHAIQVASPRVAPLGPQYDMQFTSDVELRRQFVRENVSSIFLTHTAKQLSAKGSFPATIARRDILRTERDRAIIQVGYELPPYEDPRE